MLGSKMISCVIELLLSVLEPSGFPVSGSLPIVHSKKSEMNKNPNSILCENIYMVGSTEVLACN